tara:strand:- start:472 stop:639 length:168 start_codon:yes stop_codon:yes gene_type:complete
MFTLPDAPPYFTGFMTRNFGLGYGFVDLNLSGEVLYRSGDAAYISFSALEFSTVA